MTRARAPRAALEFAGGACDRGAMRTTRLAPVVFVMCALVFVLAGCPKKNGGAADAAADGATAAMLDAAPAGPEAANVDAIARFPDESAIDHQAATLQWSANNARKAPPSGAIVATLPKGTNVVQLAAHDKYVLVTFDNPKNASERLMGWVIKDAFSAQQVVVPKGPCPAGLVQLLGDEVFCGKVCKVDTDCAGGQACSGSAQRFLHDAGAGEALKICTALGRPATSDAGVTPAPVDAGGGGGVTADAAAPAVVDAGGGGAPRPDAGGGGAPPPMVLEKQADGTCPANYKIGHPDDKCHHLCGSSADCGVYGPGVFCTQGKYCKMR